MKRLFEKLNSTRGESLSETMISSLVIALGFILAVSMILAASNMVSNADKKWKEYYENKNTLEERAGGSAAGILTLKSDTQQISENIVIYSSEDETLAAYEKAK